MKRARIYPIATALLLAIGCLPGGDETAAETIAEDIEARPAAVSNGTADTVFSAVCGMQVQAPPDEDNNERPLEYCSCVLVGERAVLTSASCIDELEEEDPIDFTRIDLRFGTGYGDGTPVAVDAIDINRQFRIDQVGETSLAMLHLAGDPPAGVEPLPVFEGNLAQEFPEDGVVVLVGFGANVEGESAESGFGTRRRGETGVSNIESRAITVRFEGQDPVSPCPGDRGGAILLEDGNDVELIGVMFGTAACETTSPSVHPRVDVVAQSLILPFIDRYSGLCPVDGECTEVGCRSPDPDCERCLQQGPRLPGDEPVVDPDQDDPPPDCFLTGNGGSSCPTRDPDCGLGAALGQECNLTAECETDGGCIEAGDDEQFTYCTVTCEADDNCPDNMECAESGVCEFLLPSPGSQGFRCVNDFDCPRGNSFCIEAICVTTCETDADCPANLSRFRDEPYRCEASPAAGGQRVCLGPVLSGGGGFCAPTVAGAMPGGRRGALGSVCLLMLVALALVWVRRRRS